MPTYDFLHNDTGEIIEIFFSSWQDKDAWLAENSEYTQTLTKAPGIVSGVSSQNKVPDGFKEVLSKVAEAHRYTDIGDKYGRAGIKEAKTKEVVRKHVDRVSKRLQNGK